MNKSKVDNPVALCRDLTKKLLKSGLVENEIAIILLSKGVSLGTVYRQVTDTITSEISREVIEEMEAARN